MHHYLEDQLLPVEKVQQNLVKPKLTLLLDSVLSRLYFSHVCVSLSISISFWATAVIGDKVL